MSPAKTESLMAYDSFYSRLTRFQNSSRKTEFFARQYLKRRRRPSSSFLLCSYITVATIVIVSKFFYSFKIFSFNVIPCHESKLKMRRLKIKSGFILIIVVNSTQSKKVTFVGLRNVAVDTR